MEMQTSPVRSPNARAHAHHAELLNGCTLADNFPSLDSVELNGGIVSGAATLNRYTGITVDGSSRVSYPAESFSDFTVVLSFTASSGGVIATNSNVKNDSADPGWSIWVDDDGVHATHGDGTATATECFLEGEFTDSTEHVVTYAVDLSGGTHTLYVDSSSDDSVTTVSGPIASTKRICVGAGYLSDNVTGIIGGIRIYNGSVLTEDDHSAYAS